VVLYYPNLDDIIHNIKTYEPNVSKIYVIDNTPVPDPNIESLLYSISKVIYLPNHDNLGIAKALNIACAKAISDGFKWIITFDQDSYCLPETIGVLQSIANVNVGLVSPIYLKTNDQKELKNWNLKHDITEVENTITSCSLTNLEAFIKVGGFDETLFIDLVDTDFSFKLRNMNYKLLLTNKTYFIHSIGNGKFTNFLFFKNIKLVNQNPTRNYYITRNRLYFFKKYNHQYHEFCVREKKLMIKEIIKAILFEDKKMAKAKAIFWGVFDFYKGNFGKTERTF
jgi:rhamnosyltransferase